MEGAKPELKNETSNGGGVALQARAADMDDKQHKAE